MQKKGKGYAGGVNAPHRRSGRGPAVLACEWGAGGWERSQEMQERDEDVLAARGVPPPGHVPGPARRAMTRKRRFLFRVGELILN